MQEIVRRLGRAALTILRELRRNAATRSGGLEYCHRVGRLPLDAARLAEPQRMRNAALEISRLRREDDRLRMDRDILRKAADLSNDSQRLRASGISGY